MKTRQKGTMMIDLIAGCAIGMMLLLAIAEINTSLRRGQMAHQQGARLAAGAAALQAMLDKHGKSIAFDYIAPGFTNPSYPMESELRRAGFLPSFVPTQLPFGGKMVFSIYGASNKSLIGLACGDQSIVGRDGQPAGDIAGQVMQAANGLGVRTTVSTPLVLNGPAFQGVPTPIIGPAVVCAWAATPSQLK